VAKKSLIIVESPAKARTIQKFVDSNFTVKASMGHIRDLPKSRIGVDIDHDFAPKYVTIKGKEKIIEELRKEAKKCESVYLAPDPDREGEAIAWHLSTALDVPNSSRIALHEITRDALKAALQNSGTIDMKRVDAQQARRILDRLVGYKLSPLLWRKVRYGLSAGRVQSVAVRLIVDRKRDIDKFQETEFWTITAELSKPQEKSRFSAELIKENNKKAEIADEKKAREIEELLKGAPFVVKKNPEKRIHKKEPAAPFITSTLQQEASRRLNFNVGKTMRVAQQLFEGLDLGDEGSVGLITYMRTDSTRISEAAREEACEFIRKAYGDEYVGPARVFKKSKGAQEAHECIRPTGLFRNLENLRRVLSNDQFRLYKLIFDRLVASQMASCEEEVITADIDANIFLFRAQGRSVLFPGFTRLYTESKDEKDKDDEGGLQNLPRLSKGDQLTLNKLIPRQHFTQPPPQYTEATLVKALEKNGIGRPSTYAPIVETIQKRGYVELKEKKFSPTNLGIIVTDLLIKHFSDIVGINFTAQIEEKLDKIEEGKARWVNVIRDFYQPFIDNLNTVEKQIEKVQIEKVKIVYEETDEKCEKCQKPMVIKKGRFGKFLACSGFPECKNTKPFLEKIGVSCPREGCNGSIVTKRSKRGLFYGCEHYPKCDFTSWNRPIDEKCTACSSLMVIKSSRNGKTFPQCSNKDCVMYQAKSKEPAAPSEEATADPAANEAVSATAAPAQS
jgi:DNA topoisomerase I